MSVPENEFFFDFVRHLLDWMRKSMPPREGQVYRHTRQLVNGRPSKWVRISCLWNYFHYLSIPMYTISWPEPFSRHALYFTSAFVNRSSVMFHNWLYVNVDLKVKIKQVCLDIFPNLNTVWGFFVLLLILWRAILFIWITFNQAQGPYAHIYQRK